MARVTFVVGKRPRTGTVVADVIELLDGLDIVVHLPHDEPGPMPERVFGSDLVVQRGLRQRALVDLAAVELAGVRCCNPIDATLETPDRLLTARRLSAAGIAVPATRSAATWAQVRHAAAAGPVVVKSVDGSAGRGVGVAIAVDGELPTAPPFDGPLVLQELVSGDGDVHKCYVAGDKVWTLVKPASLARHRPQPQGPFRPSPHGQALADLAIATGEVLGLEIYNVDVILGPQGPRVIDVNAFPGFRGIPDAAQHIVAHIRALIPWHRRH